MSIAAMMGILFIHLLSLVSGVAASGQDFTNNLFSDIAPLLALFGENFAQQFLSESFTWVEHIIFAMAPLGIITAIVSAIRVGGFPWMKAVVGRARENRASAELDLMSSTSHEVCELWNGEGIVRTTGKGMVKQMVFLEGCGEEREFGLFTLTGAKERTPAYMRDEAYRGPFIQKLWELWNRQHASREDSEAGSNTQDELAKKCNPEKAPNISLNLHKKRRMWELAAAAVLGFLLQSGVIVFSGFTAYNSRLSERVGGRVGAYAFPLLAVGTGILVLGMWICSFVIGQSTDEYAWRKAREKTASQPSVGANISPKDVATGAPVAKKIRVFWLQMKHSVSDQSFDSFMIMAQGTRETILTSRRRDGGSALIEDDAPDSDAGSKHALHLFWIRSLALLGTVTGLSGFVLQFEGFRGMSWACSIAQLVAIFVMTILRAIIRRGMLDRPNTAKALPDHEMDWLALRIGLNPEFEFLVEFSKESKSARCAQCGKGHLHQESCNRPKWEVCNRPGYPAIAGSFESTVEEMGKGQDTMKVRKRLGDLTGWITPASKYATSIANAIGVVMETFKWPGEKFTWYLDVRFMRPEADDHDCQKISFAVNKTDQKWEAETCIPDITAALSLWMCHFQEEEDVERKQNSQMSEGPEEVTGKLRPTKLGTTVRQVLGPWEDDLRQDLAWWIGGDVISTLEKVDTKPVTPEPALYLGFCGLKPKPDGYIMTVKSSVLRERFLAKHIFSAFMWAIAAHIPGGEFDLTSVELHSMHNSNPDDPKWNSLKLTNPTIQKMARGIERAGLGTLEEAYMTIIPPLSVANTLPNEAVVDFVRRKAREHEQSRQWHEAFNAYNRLLELCQPRGSNDRFVYKAVAAVIDFLVLSTSAPLAEDRETSSGSDWNLGKVRSDLAEVLNSRTLQDVTFSLRTIYDKQGRIKDFDNVIIRGKGRKQFMRPLEKVSFVCPSWHSKLDSILSMKTINDGNMLGDEELRASDILDWTPLNYAVIRNPKMASNMLSRWSEGAKKKDFAERTPLQYAVMRLMYSADRTTLDHNARREEHSLMKRLLEKAPKPERGRDGLLPLHWAAKLGDEEAVDLLLDNHSHGNRVNSTDNWGRTALHLAACRGSPQIVDRLLVKGANIDTKDHFGNTALMLAVEMEQNIDKRMTEAERQNEGGRDKARGEGIARETERKKEIEGEEAGKGGAEKGEKEKAGEQEHLPKRWQETRKVINILLGRTDVGPESAGGGDLLLWAVTEGYKTFFGLLMEKKAKDDEKDSTGRTALHVAAMSGFRDVVKQLLDRWEKEKSHEAPGEKVPARQQESVATNKQTPYTEANAWDQKSPQASQVSGQIRIDSNRIDPRDREDMTPLLLAAKENHAYIVRMLLDRGAYEEAECSYRRSSLSWAAERGHIDVIKILLDHRANITQKDSFNKTPLEWAEEKGHTQIVELFLNLQLGKLLRADGAAFDSQLQGQATQCLPGTQVDLLQQIMTWSEDPNGVHIFWLNGMAGTGKSTIARTLAHAFASRKRLGASFFFSRSQSDLDHAAKFFTTIAAQLANKSPTLRHCIFEAIDKHNNIYDQTLGFQWEQLVLQPLSNLEASSLQSPLILVIDALDECESENDVQEILRLLTEAKTLKTIQLRVFLTSRPESAIRLGFRAIPRSLYRDLPLRDMSPTIIEGDISVFFRHKLGEIRQESGLPAGWPGERAIECLAQKSGGSFVYAATTCQFIRYRPEDHLSLVLQEDTAGQPPTKQLDAIYTQVLRHAIVNYEEQEKKVWLEGFRQIVGHIITLFHPLTANALAKLLGMSTRMVYMTLDSLRSVLDIPESQDCPVRLLHISFRDFLLDQRRCFDPQFWISEREAHDGLFICCLKLMSNHLRRDMCNLRLPGALATEAEQSKVEECLPPDIQYACRYWVYHLQRGNVDPCDNDRVHIFLQEHLLHWLEALSLMGNMSDGVVMVTALESMLTHKPNSSPLLFAMIREAKLFILNYKSIIGRAPLQLYCSALIFSPNESKIRKLYWDEVPRWVLGMPITPTVPDWNPSSQIFEGHLSSVYAIAFSPDGQLLASTSGKTVSLWNLRTGASCGTLEGHSDSVLAVEFSPDGQLLASASNDSTVRLWNPVIGAPHSTLKGHLLPVNAVAFSSDGQFLASASNDNTIRLWNPETGASHNILEGHSDWVRAVAFSPDGQLLASASDDCTARVWDPRTGASCGVLEGHSGWIRAIAFSPDSQLLASASDDNTVRLWNLTTGAQHSTLEGHSSSVYTVAFSPDGKVLASSSDDGIVRLWDPRTAAPRATLEGHLDWVRAIAFSPDGQLLASASDDNTVRLWDLEKMALCGTLKDHSDWVRAVAFSPDGQLLASGSYDKTVRLWDPRVGISYSAPEGHSDGVRVVVFSPDGQILASASCDNTVKLWDPKTGAPCNTLGDHSGDVTAVAFSPNGQLLASASYDNTIKLWNPMTGALHSTLEGHSDCVKAVAFQPDSQVLASASDDNTIKLWDPVTGALHSTLEGHSDCVNAVAFQPDSQVLASASDDNTIKLWNPMTGALHSTLEGHSDCVKAVAFQPDSQVLASASDDNTIRLWDIKRKEKMQEFDTDGTISKLSFTRDGSHLVTDQGVFELKLSTTPKRQSRSNSPYIYINQHWVNYKEKKLLWLPPNYRPNCWAARNNILALGCGSGRVTFMELAPDTILPGDDEITSTTYT